MEISTNAKIGIGLSLAALAGVTIYLVTKKSGANLKSNGNTAQVGVPPKGGVLQQAGTIANTVKDTTSQIKDIVAPLIKTDQQKQYKDGLKYACGTLDWFPNKTDKANYDSCKLLYDENWAVISKSASFDAAYNGATDVNAEGQKMQIDTMFNNPNRKPVRTNDVDLVYQTKHVY